MRKERKKNPAAVALGRLGGKARAKRLTPEELSEIGKRGSESMTPEERKERAMLAGQASGQARKAAANARKRKKSKE
jgi:general stress protein YciG